MLLTDDDDEPSRPGARRRERARGTRIRACPLCGGRGRMEIVIDRQQPRRVVERPCIICRGTGLVTVED